MKTLISIAYASVLLFTTAVESRAQCAAWGHLSQIGYTQGASCMARGPGPNDVVWGGHNIDSPHVSSQSPGISTGAQFISPNSTTTEDWLYGVVDGVAYFDLGAGPVLHAWGTMSGLGTLGSPSFRTVSPAFVAVNATAGVMPGRLLAVTVFDSGAGISYHAATQSAVWRWNGSSWVSLGATIGAVTQLVVHDDGTGSALFAAGDITMIGGVAVVGVARWNGTSWSAVSGLSSSTLVDVTTLASLQTASGKALFAGGNFADANGSPANGVARWNGSVWSGLGVGLPFTVARVAGMDMFDLGDGKGALVVVSAQSNPPGQNTIAGFDGVSWSALSTLPGTAPAGGMAILAADLPNTPGRDLVALLDHPWSTFSTTTTWVQLEACSQTGALGCFGDGAAIACPCGNESASGDRAGCLNSLTIGATMRGRGRTSLSSDSAQIDGGSMPNGPLLYFQGTAFGVPFAFGDGLKCASGQLVRLGIRVNANQSSTFPGAGSSSLSASGFVSTPGTRYYQARYRDSASFCTNETFNYTNSVAFVWSP